MVKSYFDFNLLFGMMNKIQINLLSVINSLQFYLNNLSTLFLFIYIWK